MAWVAEDDFDSYSDGDLNTLNGGTGFSGAWTADTDYDIQGTTTYEGAKAVTQTSSNGGATRTLTTDVASGILYVATRANSTMISSDDSTLRLWDTTGSSDIRVLVGWHTGTIKYGSSSTLTTLISSPAANTWYLIEIELVAGGNYKLRYHDGTSWSTQTSSLAPYTGDGGDVRTVNLNSGGGGGTSLWDYISPTNPISAGGPANLKSLNTNILANIKSINGNLIANCKSLNTNV